MNPKALPRKGLGRRERPRRRKSLHPNNLRLTKNSPNIGLAFPNQLWYNSRMRLSTLQRFAEKHGISIVQDDDGYTVHHQGTEYYRESLGQVIIVIRQIITGEKR